MHRTWLPLEVNDEVSPALLSGRANILRAALRLASSQCLANPGATAINEGAEGKRRGRRRHPPEQRSCSSSSITTIGDSPSRGRQDWTREAG